MKNMLLSLVFFILIILLLLPPVLRIFGKDLYKEKKIPKPKEELEILNCTKINETINTSFLNGKAYNIKYEISGNHAMENEIEESLLNENEEINNINLQENTIIMDLKKYASITYVEDKNLTEFRIALNTIDNIPSELINHTRSINEVSMYYKELSFSCTIQKY